MGKLQRPSEKGQQASGRGDKPSTSFERKKRESVAPNEGIASKPSDALGDIFLQLKSSKKEPAKESATLRSSTEPKSTPGSTAPKPTGDGLYRAKSQTVEMCDDAFFGSTTGASSGAMKGKKSKKSSNVSSGRTRNKEAEGVDQLITEDELLKITSNLTVKALAQPLGSENAWSELGDGRVDFAGATIRVIALPENDEQSPTASATAALDSTSTDAAPEEANNNNETSESLSQLAERACPSPRVVLEDTITNETPFVGENCCIVWNSMEQELSLCVMFGCELDFQAAWSALAAMQHKPYPPLGKDLFEKCRAGTPPLASAKGDGDDAAGPAHQPEPPTPYHVLLNPQAVNAWSFIERHACALSLMEYGHLQDQGLYADRDVCLALLKLGHADLLEHLVAPAFYPMYLAGLEPTAAPPGAWGVPHGLKETLATSSEFESCLRTALCLHHLKHEVLPVGVDEDVIAVIDGVNHRLQNEAACNLLADDALISTAVQALNVLPVEDAGASVLSRSTTPTESSPASPAVAVDSPNPKEMPPAAAEQHVADHLRFFTSLISLSISAFSKELVAPVMGKIFSQGLLEALSRVAERYTVPTPAPIPSSRRASPDHQSAASSCSRPGSSSARPAPPSKETQKPNRPHRHAAARTPTRMHSPMVEKELSRLFDATLVRLNEKQEEVAVNDFFRCPILDDPDKFQGLLAFFLRQLMAEPLEDEVGRSLCKERGATNHSFLLYHLLGMHDDEGSSCSDRLLDPENEARRNDFHAYVIKQLIGTACKGQSIVIPMEPAGPQSHHRAQSVVSPPLIRVMEYLLRLSTGENKELLLLRIFDPASQVLQCIEAGFMKAASGDRTSVAPDVLCGHLRFLKAVLSCVCSPAAPDTNAVLPPAAVEQSNHDLNVAVNDAKEDVSSNFLPLTGPRLIDRKVLALAAKHLTLERDMFCLMLDVYHRSGGSRKQGLLHSTIRSLLLGVAAADGAHAENIATFLLLKHRSKLPPAFIERVEKRMMEAVVAKLDVLAVVRASGRASASPVLVQGVSHLDVSAASCSPLQSPLGRYLVDEVASPPDAKQMEDVAAFPRKLRQAIGRLSPTPPRSSTLDDEGTPGSAKAADLQLFPIPKGSSPLVGALAHSPLPLAKQFELDKHPAEDVSPPPPFTSPSDALSAKPSAPKQAKGQTGRGGRQLGDGKPLMRSK